MTDALTRPERSCARGQSRDIADAVREDGGCCYCLRRAGVFESIGRRALCGLTPPRQFPTCVGAAQGFDFDEAAFREGAGRDMTRERDDG